MNEHVLVQSLLGRKPLVARRANVRLMTDMSLHVPLNLASLGKPGCAFMTPWAVIPGAPKALGSLCRVLDVSRGYMVEEFPRVCEYLPADPGAAVLTPQAFVLVIRRHPNGKAY